MGPARTTNCDLHGRADGNAVEDRDGSSEQVRLPHHLRGQSRACLPACAITSRSTKPCSRPLERARLTAHAARRCDASRDTMRLGAKLSTVWLMSRFGQTETLYIRASRRTPRVTGTFESINPANGEVLAELQHAEPRRCRSRRGERDQRSEDLGGDDRHVERSRILRRAVAILRERNDDLAVLEALDTGKPLSETRTPSIS